MIKTGVNATLDEYIDLDTHAQERLTELENRERTATGISSLKVKYNSIFGYSFEVTKTNLSKVPSHFVRRQTMAQGERFVSSELSDLEQKILSSQQKRYDLEFQIFADLRSKILKNAMHFLSLSTLVAEIDLATSWAQLATEENYCRPEFVKEGFDLKGARHPVIEKSRKDVFIPNDIALTSGHVLLLTGPNMAGKSTLMRQVALISLLAHCGSYVPAASAKIPLLDQIFTRIGAQDNLAQGLSTFMVEMTETAEIINSATPNSLVILDEIGRGTSTYDGMSLAQAVLEHFITEVKSYTFFATHYHELTEILRPEIINAHIAIKEHKGELIFLRKLQKGPANRSYGIDVARQAGLPKTLTDKAQDIMNGIVRHSADRMGPVGLPPQVKTVADEIKTMPLNSLTPLEALNHLSRFQSDLQDVDL
jgi:DNA mismatch repair protein MutS